MKHCCLTYTATLASCILLANCGGKDEGKPAPDSKPPARHSVRAAVRPRRAGGRSVRPAERQRVAAVPSEIMAGGELALTSGARLVGYFFDQDNYPVTNVTARHIDTWDGDGCPVELTVEEDGAYCSEILAQGIRELIFSAPGYAEVMRKVAVMNEPVMTDVLFVKLPDSASRTNELCVVTGRVLDAASRAPIPRVFITYTNSLDGTEQILFTDDDGIFNFSDYGPAELTFSHHDYTEQTVRYSQSQSRTAIVHMLSFAVVVVRVFDYDGMLTTEFPVQMVRDRETPFLGERYHINGYIDEYEGATVFSNLPTHIGTMVAAVMRRSRGYEICASESLVLFPNQVLELDLVLPQPGKLKVRFPDEEAAARAKLHALPYRTRGAGYPEGRFSCVHSRGFIAEGRHRTADRIIPGEYVVRVICGDAFRLSTNLTIEAFRTTVLNIEDLVIEEPDKTGVIQGDVHDERGRPLQCCVRARMRAKEKTHYDVLKHVLHAFRIEGLARDHTYNLDVNVAEVTNFVLAAVVPDGEFINIILPPAYRVTGRVENERGMPLPLSLGIRGHWDYDVVGEFQLHPVFPGTHTIVIRPDGYLPLARTFSIVDSDVDLGVIVVSNMGVRVTGRVVDQRGHGQHEFVVEMRSMAAEATERGWVGEGNTSMDGTFVITGVPRNKRLRCEVMGRRLWTNVQTNLVVVTTDRDTLDLGNIKVRVPSGKVKSEK